MDIAESLPSPLPDLFLRRLLFFLIIAHDAELAAPALPGAELGVAIRSAI
jgi:hypothetical protein